MKKIILSILFLAIAIPAYASFQDTAPFQTYNYKAISTQTTTIIKSGPGILHNITVTGGTTGTIIVYNNTVASTDTVIGSFSTTNTPNNYPFDVSFASGCTVVTGAATNLTVTYL